MSILEKQHWCGHLYFGCAEVKVVKMKLGTLKSNEADGQLVVVSRDNQKCVAVPQIAANMGQLLENWQQHHTALEKIYNDLNEGKLSVAMAVDQDEFHSPLPRCYGWLDGSAFIQHVILVRKARNAEPPATLREIPLMYQGGSDDFLAPRDNIPMVDPSHGVDFEGEVGVIVGDVPMGVKEKDAHQYIKLITIINDVSLRGIIKDEIVRGFGFLQGKPSSAFAPFCITPDELGSSWKDGRIHLPLNSEYNGEWFGHPNAGQMHFSFGKLIEHAARTRNLKAGTIIGSGTVSNEDPNVGSSCLAERRYIEMINDGKASTPFMQNGSTIKIEMLSETGENLFGTIYQKVVKTNFDET